MSPLNEVSNMKQPVKKRVKKTKATGAKAPAPVVAPGDPAPVAVKDEEKNKAPNFHPDEDELIAKAWVSASENPIVGNGQKAATFWADVHSRYCLLQEKSESVEVQYPRSWNQIKGRFLRHIQVNVGVFNRYYKRAKDLLPSGEPETVENLMEIAMNEYASDQKKPFRFSLCVPILHALPKFDPFLQEDEMEEEPSSVGRVMGSSLERPMGSKAAKGLKQANTETGKNVEVMKKDFHRLVESALRKEAFDELTSLYKMYQSIGDTESALAVKSDLQDMVFHNKMQRQAEKEEDDEEARKKSAKESACTTGTPVPPVPGVIRYTPDREGVALPRDESDGDSFSESPGEIDRTLARELSKGCGPPGIEYDTSVASSPGE